MTVINEKLAGELEAVFRPKSIAVIGATPRQGTIGHQLLQNIIEYGFNGMVFPVNPNHKFIKSIKCHPSILNVPDPVDLAIIAVPKEYVLQVAEECGKKGVKGMVVITAGFREIGGDGIEREENLVKLARQYGFRIVGPNCMGLINADPDVRLNATFAASGPASGSLAFLTQSGALGVAILLAATKLNVGLSHFVSVGNKADISGNDMLEYWGDDDNAKIIALYLESFGEPRRFTELAKRITKRKPVILVKSGTTAAGARAASSHTGHLAGLEIAVDALLHQCGVIRLTTINQMIDLALGFTRNPIPRGDRVAILSNAGGPAIMATDNLVNAGLSLAKLSETTCKQLKAMLPEESSVRNPVDMIAGAGPAEYQKGLDIILADEGVDVVIVIFVPPIMVEPVDVVEKIAASTRLHDKPVFSVLMAEDRYYEELPRAVKDAPPLYRFPESVVRVITDMNRYRLWCEKPEGKVKTFQSRDRSVSSLLEKKQKSGGGYLQPLEVNRLLEAYGFPVCKAVLVGADDEVADAARHVGFPLVLKVYGEEIIHKSDFGGVTTNIKSPLELSGARAEMVKSLDKAGLSETVDGFLIQEMAGGGKEVILGMTTDEKFGPIVMFGMGGTYVEIIKDITFRLMPVTDLDAREMVREIKSFPLLKGVRGEEGIDLDFLEESILRLAQIVHDFPSIIELDMNPVMVTPRAEGCQVVDARIRVSAL